MAKETRKVKLGDKAVQSRFAPRGYAAGETVEVSKEEAKALTDAKLASYASSSEKKEKVNG